MNDMDKAFADFGGFDGWLNYAEAHYLSALRHATLCGDTCPLSGQDRRLLGFLHDDIIKMMNNRG